MLKMKQCISLLLVLCVMLVVAPLTAHAATGGSCGENVTWSINEDGVLIISGTGPMEDYDVDYAPWFDNLDLVSSVKIENGVTTIGAYAFMFSDITAVEIPDSVTTICQGAFSYSIYLASVEIPDSVTTIGGYAFADCSSLTSVKFYGDAPEIGEEAFKNVTATVYYPANNSTWTADAVENCGGDITWTPYMSDAWKEGGSCGENVTWRIIEDGVLIISGTGPMADYDIDYAPWFDYLDLVTSAKIENGVTTIGAYAFMFSDITAVEIPDSVTTICQGAFCYSIQLASVEIPDSVTTIGGYAFADCSSLTSVKFYGDAPEIGEDAFKNVTATAYYPADNPTWTAEVMNNYGGDITWVPYGSCGENVTWSLSADGVLTISGTGPMADYTYESSPWYSNCTKIKSVYISNGVTSIGDSAFYGCSSLTEITIPEGVTSIGDYAFANCSSLTKITIPGSVTSIGDYAFFGCSSLTEITIPEGVTSIGMWAFYGCSSLTEITIPEGVTSIGSSAFDCCSSLTQITIPEGVTSIDSSAFSGCSSLTEINLPEGVTSIGYAAFSGCSSLTEITIPESVTSIGDDAFFGCSSLTEITIPEGVTSIGNYAFEDCSSLTQITIPEGVTSIGDHAFFGCSSLTEITIPEGVTSIGWYAFSGCSSLTEITIPEGVTSIDYAAFNGCSSLTEITIPEGVTSIGEWAFSGCSNLTEITIPESVTSIGDDAFFGCSSLTDVYYGGTETQWDELGNTRDITWIHYNCPTADGHWMVHGKLKVCDCGYIAGENPFADVPRRSFYYDPVMWAVVNDITTGATPTTFDPNGKCLRAHVVTFLHRAAGSPEPTSTNNPFTDVASGSFFYKPVLWAVENSITNGTSATTFGAYANCNRAAVVTFLWRAAGSPEPESTDNPFVDVATDAFYYKAVLWAVENGITNGVDATHFGPTANCSRAQVVTFLYRTYK